MTDLDLIDRYFNSINAEDWGAFAQLWDDRSELLAVGARPRRGAGEIEAFYRGLFTPWSKHRDQPVRVLPSGDAVTVEIHFDGTTHDGRELAFDAVDVFDLEDGRIRKLSTWYDLVLVRRLLESGAADPGVVDR